MNLQAIILAAGMGTRLQPITNTRSKAMLPIVGKPIILRIMESLTANGIDEFILVVNPKDNDLLDYFRVKSNFPAQIHIVFQPRPLGMANALSCAVPLIRGDFLLSACDSLVSDTHIGQLINAWTGSPGLSAVLSCIKFEPERIGSTSAVELNGKWVTKIIEKPPPDQIHSGISSIPLYIISSKILTYLDDVTLSTRCEYELQDLIQRAIDLEGRVLAVLADTRFNLTNPSDLLSINFHFLSQEGRDHIPSSNLTTKHYRIHTPVFIEEPTTIGPESVIGPQVFIEQNCDIGSHVNIHKAVVLRGAKIPDRMTIHDQVVY